MSKRVLSLLLVSCLISGCLVVSASAAEVDQSQVQLVNVLEYATPNDSGDYYFYADSSGVANPVFNLPFGTMIRYVDVYFWTSASSVDSVFFSVASASAELTVESLGSYYYRVYGSITTGASSALASSFGLTINTDTAGAKFQLFSLRMSPQVVAGSSAPSVFLLEDQSATQSSGTSAVTLEVSLNAAFAGHRPWTSSVRNSNWRKYDYMTFSLSYWAHSINNINVQINGIPVPFEYNMLDTPPGFDSNPQDDSYTTVSGIYSVSVTVDLTGFDKTQTGDLIVTIQGLGTEVSGTLHRSSGYSPADLPEAELTWLQKIWNTLTDGFQSVVNAITGDTGAADEFQDDVDDKTSELETMAGIMDSVDTPDDFSPEIAISGDIDSGLDGFGPGLTYVITSPYVFPLILMSLTLAFVSYALFGKRG